MGGLGGIGIVVLAHDWTPCHSLKSILLLRIAKRLLDAGGADCQPGMTNVWSALRRIHHRLLLLIRWLFLFVSRCSQATLHGRDLLCQSGILFCLVSFVTIGATKGYWA